MDSLQTQVADWVATLNINQWIIDQQIKGLTHADSLRPLPFRGNRLNWVLGHLAEHRDWMLRAVDAKTLMPAKEAMLYRRGSESLTDDSDVVEMATLVGYLNEAKGVLLTAVQAAADPFLLEKPETGLLLESMRDRTRLQRLQGLLWHETYHVGQLELLRQLTGTDDKVL